MREAALSELDSAPRLGVDSCAGGSETRSTAGTRDCLKCTCDYDVDGHMQTEKLYIVAR